jgi:hypothetical protein
MDGRQTKSDDNSSHGLKPGELKKGKNQFNFQGFISTWL